MKMLEMEEMVSDDRSDRLEMSWTEAGFDDVDYFQLLKDSTPDQVFFSDFLTFSTEGFIILFVNFLCFSFDFNV